MEEGTRVNDDVLLRLLNTSLTKVDLPLSNLPVNIKGMALTIKFFHNS